eukprot:3396168-Amphidinium_carterae.1
MMLSNTDARLIVMLFGSVLVIVVLATCALGWPSGSSLPLYGLACVGSLLSAPDSISAGQAWKLSVHSQWAFQMQWLTERGKLGVRDLLYASLLCDCVNFFTFHR